MDGSGPPRANAAQLAARNIKSIKPRRGGGRATPLRSDPSVPQFPPMQSQGGQGGGSLFGGSIQGAGSFNFTSNGPSFPPPTFGGGNVNNPFGMSNGSSPEPSDNDERRDPGEEPSRKKRFESGVQQGNSPFQASNLFGQTQQSNPFGTANGGQQNGGIFSFGAAPSQPQPAINFNPVAAEKPGTNIFSFGTTSSQPPTPSPSINFGSATQDKTGNNIFSFGQQPAQPQPQAPSSGFNFGSPAPAEKPTSTPFSFGQSSHQPASTVINFGSTPATDAPASNIFGTSQPPSTNLFGSTNKQPPPSNPFASLNTPVAPTSNLFGSREQSPTPPATNSNLFGNREQSPNPPSNGLFGGQLQQPTPSTSTLFGNSSQPPTSLSLFGEQKSQPSTNMFGSPNKTPSTSNLFNKPSEERAPSLFGSSQKQTPSTNDLFGALNKSVDQSVVEPKPNATSAMETSGTPITQSSSLFNSQPSSDTLFGGSKSLVSTPPTTQAESSSPKKPAFSFESTPSSSPESSKSNNIFTPVKSMEAPTSANEPPPTGMFPSLQQPASPQKSNDALNNSTTSMPFSTEPTPATISRIMKGGDPPKEASHNGANFTDLAIAKQITEEYMAPLVPEKFTDEQRKDFYAAYRMRALNKSMQHYFGSLRITADPTAAMKFYSEQRTAILEDVRLRKASKRKAPGELDLNDGTPNKRAKQGDTTDTVQPPSPARRSASPGKQPYGDNSLQPYLNGNTTPQATTLAPPQSFTPSAGISTYPSPKGKRKAEEELTKDIFEEGERPIRQMRTPKLNGSGGGSNTSNIFKNILDSPSKSNPAKSPTKKTASLPTAAKNEVPRVNPFGNLPVPVSPTKSTAPPPLAGNISSPKPVEPVAPKDNAFKPPTFITGPVNFMAQFGQQAKKDEKDNEQKLMEQAKEEDMDSDEDEGEWEANWKEKRRAELKKLDEISKSRTGGFVFGQVQKKTEEPVKPVGGFQPATTPKPVFGLNATTQNSGNGLFSPLNVSRTSTPGPVSSAPGSVFDGHTSGKPVSFGGNIFGHLSDSGADSGKSDDADDESGDDTDADGDSENKDPNYKPNEDGGSSPGTPAEETGAGIASAKKSNLFALGASKSGGLFGSSNSGTSSPGGSLFDRINKDSNGNPIRHISTEEKENTLPSTTNIFGDIKNPFSVSLNKAQGAPTDQTWKPDSPIRFGSATPSNDTKDSAPTVSVTAATPTKSGSPAGIFGNLNSSSGPTSAPFSNLFGNLSNAKPAAAPGVGFSFGGSSNTSSLFPSATTSRATSPGGTTDGDSAAEPDADAEKHEQIDLTAGGPGEEDEEVVHEVRAKALKFSPKEDGDNGNPWETKGVGPLRVLRHKENKTVRILLRADPRGTIVLNKGILAQVNYEASGKTLKLLTAGESGKGLETWILQVKTPEFAQSLAEILESNKPS